MHEARLPREAFTIWNIVPWYLPDGSRTRAPKMTDVLDASHDIEAVLEHFHRLELVITMGKFASNGWSLLRARSKRISSIEGKPAPHPSATNLNRRPEQRAGLLEIMRTAAARI